MLDKYVYPGTDVLINKLDIRDSEQLGNMESIEYQEAFIRGIPNGNFDLAHLQQIHKEVFGALYTWAGQLRTIDISKGSSTFCRSEYVVPEANKLLNSLAKENYLTKIKDLTQFISRFAHYYAEINVIHPFREGNGRTTRLFFEQLALHNNYRLDLSNITRNKWMEASIESFNCNNTKLEQILREALFHL